MNLKSDIKKSVEEIQEVFPFHKYITENIYYEMYAIMSELRKLLPVFNNRKLLDIGCGPMDKTGIFKIMGFDCHAVDDLNDPWHLRDNNILHIKKYAEKIGINFYHQKPGEYNIPFKANSFDVVCSLNVIEHLHESPRILLNSMGNFARSGGLLVIIVPNSVNLRKRLAVLTGRTNYPPVDMVFHSIGTWRGHVREYTLSETNYICRAVGFEVLCSTTFECLAYQKLSTPLRELYLLLGKIVPTLRSSILAVCRKPEIWKPVHEDPLAYRNALARAVPEGVV